MTFDEWFFGQPDLDNMRSYGAAKEAWDYQQEIVEKWKEEFKECLRSEHGYEIDNLFRYHENKVLGVVENDDV